MAHARIQLGKVGEEAAVAYLKSQGYRILERNFRNKLGEIDIIAQDKDTLCFIEVKTRSSEAFGSPFEAVNAAKQRAMARVARAYLQTGSHNAQTIRFDVIAVHCDGDRAKSIDIVKDAFEVL